MRRKKRKKPFMIMRLINTCNLVSVESLVAVLSLYHTKARKIIQVIDTTAAKVACAFTKVQINSDNPIWLLL